MREPPVSLVVCVYNEEESLPPLMRRVRDVLGEADYELVIVDDGSTDKSFEIARRFARSDPRIRCIRFRGNFGQTAALSAGIEAARGRVIVTMDADLQNDPADIPHMVGKIEEGFDVVSGWRRQRQDGRFLRVLPSRMANWLISRITGVRLHDLGCTLKAYRREVIKGVQLYGEMHRFIPIWATQEGARVTELVVRHHPRRYGRSKYGINRIWKVLLDLTTTKILTSYGTKPIYIFGGIGLILCGLGVGTAGVALIQRLIYASFVHRNPLALLAVFLFLAGMQLIMMGVLAELLIRIYHAARGRPAYTVRETLEPRTEDATAARHVAG